MIFKRMKYGLISFALVILTAVAGIFPTTVFVKAEEVAAYEKTNVMDDLTNATINGEPFDLEKYNFDTKKNTQVLSFIEYCYSFYEEKQEDFGLYVYVYNPKGLKFDTESVLNQVQFAITNETDSEYTKYPLKFLNMSEKADYEGLFYKFKVVLSDEQKQDILGKVNSSNRMYKVSGIELLTKGDMNATEYAVNTTYSYSGYAKGYGSNENAESTLEFTSESLETLSLEVHPAFYRPEGTNGKNGYTQDNLHSAYFSVPKKITEQYGTMKKVHATWLNAVLCPALVTGNAQAYNATSAYLGKVSDGVNHDGLDYAYLGVTDKYYIAGNWNYTFDYSYNYNTSKMSAAEILTSGLHAKHTPVAGKELPVLYMLFNAGEGTDSADGYTVSAEEITGRLTEGVRKFGGETINGKYAACMFESTDGDFTEVNITADDKFSLTSEKINKTWWDRLWGLSGSVTSTAFDGISAIYAVTEEDVAGTDKEVSVRLYISEAEVADFREVYNAEKADNTIYLFRYQVSDYVSQELTVFKKRTVLGQTYWDEQDTNAYIFSQTVNLDFDIIDVTFSTGETETVIPVVSSPIDVIPDATAPVYTESDEEPAWLKWLKAIVAAVIIVVILVIFGPLIFWLLKLVIKIILWPFKAIVKLFKGR